MEVQVNIPTPKEAEHNTNVVDVPRNGGDAFDPIHCEDNLSDILLLYA